MLLCKLAQRRFIAFRARLLQPLPKQVGQILRLLNAQPFDGQQRDPRIRVGQDTPFQCLADLRV